MAKRSRQKHVSPREFAPDIFWISPEGIVHSVIGHLSALRAKPDVYGLPVPPESPEEADRAMGDLMESGWVRGRWDGRRFSFQMERPRGLPMGNAWDFASKYRDYAACVSIDFWLPEFKRMAKDLPMGDFLAQEFPKYWGLGRR